MNKPKMPRVPKEPTRPTETVTVREEIYTGEKPISLTQIKKDILQEYPRDEYQLPKNLNDVRIGVVIESWGADTFYVELEKIDGRYSQKLKMYHINMEKYAIRQKEYKVKLYEYEKNMKEWLASKDGKADCIKDEIKLLQKKLKRLEA